MKHQHGGDIYSTDYKMDYSANINPFGMPQSVIKAAQHAILESVNYPDPSYRKLAKAIAKKEAVTEKEVICGNGAAELIFAAVAAADPKRALLIAPGFAEYEQALRTVKCEIRFYDLKPEAGFRVKEDYLEYLQEDLDMIFLCNPNNPTGLLMERELILNILQKCHDQKIRVVLDSCFLDFLEDEQQYDLVNVCHEFQNLFILKAFTKIYAMAGLRLGYGICSDTEFLDRCRFMIQPWSVSVPAQAAGEAALKETEYVQKTKSYIRKERQWLLEQLKPLMKEIYEGQANFLFFRSTEEFGMLCKNEGILIRNCSNYRGLQKGYYRIAVRSHKENEELIRVFKKILTGII